MQQTLGQKAKPLRLWSYESLFTQTWRTAIFCTWSRYCSNFFHIKGVIVRTPYSLNSSLTLFLRQWNYIPLNLFSTCLTYKLGCSKNLIFDCQLFHCHLNFCEINLTWPHGLATKNITFWCQNANAFSIKVLKSTDLSPRFETSPAWNLPLLSHTGHRCSS